MIVLIDPLQNPDGYVRFTRWLELPENRDYETVAGYLLSHLHRLPATGEIVDAQGWRFEVVDLDGRRIDKVIASRLPVPRRKAGN